MAIDPKSTVIGKGLPDSDLDREELREIVENALADVRPNSNVLAIISDKTRDDNTDILFLFAAAILRNRKVASFDALIAQGTHGLMSDDEKFAKIGIVGDGVVGNIFDHLWSTPAELCTLGTLEAGLVKSLTEGLLDHDITVTINRLLAPGKYDTVLIFGGTLPHEVAGFAGGAKYFFPGIAGPELTHATHWLGALNTVEKTIGRVETPARHLIEAAADLITQKVICFTTVVTRDRENRLRTHALFAGDFRQSLRSAAEVSQQVHIKFTGRKYKRVVALLDEHYRDLWVGGKASYKLGGIIDEGGELIIFAPHLDSISETHGKLIEKYGYAPMEIVRGLVMNNDDLRQNLCVAAHLAHVSYGSRIDGDGSIMPRYKITLATRLSEEVCHRLNLDFMDHQLFSLDEYERDPDTFVVEHAGKDLYLCR